MRLVGSAAFKAVGTSDPRPAGSIPVHLRQFVRRRTRALVACALGFFAAAPAGIALADAARPGNTESIVESVEPTTTGARFDIVGGDAFMRVRVERGHEVSASGYQHEPFFRIDKDGGVWVNERSPTVALSAQRYGTSGDVLDSVDPGGVPEWKRVATNGSYLWHDHRIHWMGSTTPPTLNAEGLVQQWSVPFTVDGVVVSVSGGLYLRDAPGSWWWMIAIPLVVVGLVVSSRLRRVATAVAAALVALVGGLSYWGLPQEARPTPTFFVLGLGGIAIAGVAELVRRRPEVVDALVSSAAIAVIVAIVLGRRIVTQRFVPGIDDAGWVRVSLPIAAGLATGAVVSSLRTLLTKDQTARKN